MHYEYDGIINSLYIRFSLLRFFGQYQTETVTVRELEARNLAAVFASRDFSSEKYLEDSDSFAII